MNILEKSYSELLPFSSPQGSVDYTQIAPPGFLLVEKFLVQLFGESEYVLRLFPFLSGIVSMFLFVKLAPYYIRPTAVPVSVLLLTTSSALITHSTSLKQYSSDVFITLLLYLLTLYILLKETTILRILLLGTAGAVAIWFSYPSVFVLASIGGGILFSWFMRKEWRGIRMLFIAYFFWLVSFGMKYLVLLRQLTKDEYLRQFWATEFMPFPPASLTDLLWFVRTFFETIRYALQFSQPLFDSISSFQHILASVFGVSPSIGLTLPDIANIFLSGVFWMTLYLIMACLLLAGCISILLQDKIKFLFLVLPILLTLLASGFYKYPFGNRLILFLVPFLYLFFGEGTAWIHMKSPLLGAICVGVLCLYSVSLAGHYLFHHRVHEEARPVIRYLKEHKYSDDVLYVYYASGSVFKYYARRFDLDNEVYILGISSRDNWARYIDDLNQLRGHKRVWLFFSHAYTEEAFFLSYLDTIGTKLDEFKDVRASVYLYDLR